MVCKIHFLRVGLAQEFFGFGFYQTMTQEQKFMVIFTHPQQ